MKAAIATSLCFAVASTAAFAGDRESARRMHDRLIGIPPRESVLDSMTAMIAAADPEGAAQLAMTNPHFYNSILKTWITPWTNEDATVFAPLNDYTATVIGIIRDDLPFTDVLTANLVYIGRGGVTGTGIVAARYSQTDNTHYEQLETASVDLSNTANLVPWPQDQLPNSQLVAEETAGVITTRAAGEAFFEGGTNRRMFRYTSMTYLCKDLEALNDVSRPVDRIRQDVTRSPGGDSQIFLNSCSGCHSGMDPMAGAFAYFEWDATARRVTHTRGLVETKNLINGNTFPYGYLTVDNRWDNYWRQGQNAALGWSEDLSGGGYGAKSLGEEIAFSRGFARCQVEKVFEQVCFREPADETERLEVERIADDFEELGYSMKMVFAKVASYCMED